MKAPKNQIFEFIYISYTHFQIWYSNNILKDPRLHKNVIKHNLRNTTLMDSIVGYSCHAADAYYNFLAIWIMFYRRSLLPRHVVVFCITMQIMQYATSWRRISSWVDLRLIFYIARNLNCLSNWQLTNSSSKHSHK